MEIAFLHFGLGWIYKTKVEIVNYGLKIQMCKRLWTVADIFAQHVFHEDGGRHSRSQRTVADILKVKGRWPTF